METLREAAVVDDDVVVVVVGVGELLLLLMLLLLLPILTVELGVKLAVLLLLMLLLRVVVLVVLEMVLGDGVVFFRLAVLGGEGELGDDAGVWAEEEVSMRKRLRRRRISVGGRIFLMGRVRGKSEVMSCLLDGPPRLGAISLSEIEKKRLVLVLI